MVSARTANCSHIIRQCEILKGKIQGKSQEVLNTLSEESTQRQKLANLYKNILLNDLPYSLEKKVELELWNNAFKSHIDNFRLKMKEKRQEKHETQAKLSLFLDASTGFYFQLLQEFCSTYELDLPFYGKNVQLGILKKPNKTNGSKKGKLNACLYICQDCLVHLGDLARYRNDLKQAESFYLLASKLLPGNGQPYNQLAILAIAKGNQALAVFNYFKSICVPNSFPAASSNLHRTLSQLLCSTNSQSPFGSSLSVTSDQFIEMYLQLMACLFLLQDLDRANNIKDRISLEFKDILTSLTKEQILTLASINLFNLTKYKPKDIEYQQHITEEESAIWHQNLTVNVLTIQCFIEYTITALKSNNVDLKEQYKCLPAIKMLFDWMFSNSNGLFDMEEFQENPLLFHQIATLGNLLVTNKSMKVVEKSVTPLEEDWQLYGVSFLRKVNKRYDFKIQPLQMSDEEILQIRIQRIISFLDWLTIHKQTSRFISKSENEEASLYICLLPLLIPEVNNPMIPDRIKAWDESSDTAGSIGDGTSSSYTERTRSLFRTDSEDKNNTLISTIQTTTMAPYSLFNSMWSTNLQNFPQSEVGTNQVTSSVLSSMNRINSLPISSIPPNIHSILPPQSLHQPYLENKRPPGLNNINPLNTTHILMEKDGMQNVPIYQHFNNPMNMRLPSAIQTINPNNPPVHINSPVQQINPIQPIDPAQLRVSPLIGSFSELPHQHQQQSFGVIGQNVRVLPQTSMFPVHIQRPTVATSDMRQDLNQQRMDNVLPESQENRSIWSSNFAIGQGELSPLEQLLQEQRRHQRMK